MSNFNYCDPFRGNTSGTAESTAFSLSILINSFRVVNKTGGAVTVNVYLSYGGNLVSIMPYNYSLSANQKYEETEGIILRPDEVIRVVASGSVDYDFTLSNIVAVDVNNIKFS